MFSQKKRNHTWLIVCGILAIIIVAVLILIGTLSSRNAEEAERDEGRGADHRRETDHEIDEAVEGVGRPGHPGRAFLHPEIAAIPTHPEAPDHAFDDGEEGIHLRNPGTRRNNVGQKKEGIEEAIVGIRADLVDPKVGIGRIEFEVAGPEELLPSVVETIGHRHVLALIVPAVKLGEGVVEKAIAHPKKAEDKEADSEIKETSYIEKKRHFLMQKRLE